MPTLGQLQQRSHDLYQSLLEDEFPTRRRPSRFALARTRTGRTSTFSFFDPESARDSLALATELAIATGAAPTVEDGLESALNLVESRRLEESPALVRNALSLFVAHFRSGRLLSVPRPVVAREAAFARSRTGTTVRSPRRRTLGITTGSASEAVLDYWREDALANEHHQHWHQVYPFSGLLPSDWNQWAGDADHAGLAALLNELDPRGIAQWRQFVDASPTDEIARAFLDRAQALSQQGFRQLLRRLGRQAYQTLFRLNDRQGELFIYMHTQMLARYDAERLSCGLPPVAAFGPPYDQRHPDGYDPSPLPGYLARPLGAALDAASATELTRMYDEIASAIADGALLGPTDAPVTIDRTIIGEAIEAAEDRLREPLRSGRYPGLHNAGHMRIAGLSVAPPGSSAIAVMADPTVAIRDPIFWRWHKGIDDLASAWQESQPAYDFTDAPPVVIRDAADGNASAWQSPDIYLVARSRFTESSQAAEKIATTVAATATRGTVRGLRGYRFTDTLTTRFATHRMAGRNVDYLTHDPFGYAVRITNTTSRATAVTIRVFLCPQAFEDRRSAWIELDKVLHKVPPDSSTVLYRSDTEFAVVKRPAEADPSSVMEGGTDPDDGSYCVCGWPWTLVIPRGTADGLPYRLFVITTDAARDQVPSPHHCGSMSYCGATDRYPDLRDMGYPFSRPLTAGIADTALAHDSIAGRALTIRHEQSP
jgi:hypothetical protein